MTPWRSRCSGIADHAVGAGFAADIVGAGGAEIVIMRGARRRRTVDERMVPWVQRWFAALHIGAVPNLQASGLDQQRLQSLIGGRVAASVELVEIERGAQPLDRLLGDGDARAA